MNNSVFGTAMADLFSVLSFGFLALVNLPDAAPVVHKINSLPQGSVLIRKVGSDWQAWQNNRWQSQIDDLKGMLLISCTEQESCLNLFNAQSKKVEQLIVALPEKRKTEAAKAFYERCSIKKQCSKITIVHTEKSIILT